MSPRYRHPPQEPLHTICQLTGRTAASGRPYWFGFSPEDGRKYLIFENSDGSHRLCQQPLNPEARASVPYVGSPTIDPSIKKEFKPAGPEHMPFVSGLPDHFGRRGRR